jgi:hypothetical protein
MVSYITFILVQPTYICVFNRTPVTAVARLAKNSYNILYRFLLFFSKYFSTEISDSADFGQNIDLTIVNNNCVLVEL